MKVVSFYTNEVYRLQAEGMKASAEAVGLSVELIERPDRGAWWKNCNQKCEVVLEAMNRWPKEDILWADADMRFLRYPAIFDGLDSEFAAFFYAPFHPIGGALWFSANGGRHYAETWAKEVAAHPEREDDSINFRAALRTVPQPRMTHLPPSYCWNEGHMRNAYPGVTEPVILHSYIGKHDYPVW